MNYNYLFIKLSVIIFCLLLVVSCKHDLNDLLTNEERQWLENQDSIIIVPYMDFAPIDFLDSEGMQTGITAEILKEIEKNINYKFVRKYKKSWSEMLNSVKNKECDIIANIQNTNERSSYLNFTTPYISIPNAIIVNNDSGDELKLNDLSYRKVAIVKDYATIDYVKSVNPSINIVEIRNNAAGLKMLSFKQVDAMIIDLAVASYYIEKLRISNLKVAGEINYNWNLCIATNKDNTVLSSVLQKGLDAINQEEIEGIYTKWVHLEVKSFYEVKEFWYTLMGIVIISILVIIVVVLLNKILKRKVKEKTYELKLAKDKAEESDRLKTEFIRNLSHEIRTPLNGIMGFSELLTFDLDEGDKKKKYASLIHSNGNQLLRIIDDIMEISRLETKQMIVKERKMHLNNVICNLISVFQINSINPEVPIKFNKGLPDDKCKIIMDENKLTRIMSNLIENALKYTIEGFVEVGYFIESEKIKLYVKDTGLGVSVDKQDVIFNRFSQEYKELSRKFGGLGLGLSIAKENAELLGGDITLSSEKNKGSVFYVQLPYKPLGKWSSIL